MPALARWSWSSAWGSGTRIAGRPIAASSATVDAPERDTTRWLAAIRCGRSRKNGATSAGDADARIGFVRPAPMSSSRACWTTASRARNASGSQLDRRRHDVRHDAGALAAAEDEDREAAPRHRRIGRCGRPRPRRAGPDCQYESPSWQGGDIRSKTPGKPVAIAVTHGRQQPVGAAHHRVLLVDDGRDARAAPRRAAAARSDSRRSRPPRPARSRPRAASAGITPRPSQRRVRAIAAVARAKGRARNDMGRAAGKSAP